MNVGEAEDQEAVETGDAEKSYDAEEAGEATIGERACPIIGTVQRLLELGDAARKHGAPMRCWRGDPRRRGAAGMNCGDGESSHG